MAETVGSIDYEVSFDTSKLIDGQRKIDRELKKTGGSFDKFGASAGDAANALKPMALAVGAALVSIGAMSVAMVKAADEMRMLGARVQVAAGSVDAGAAAMKALADISRETQTAMSANVDVFARLNSSISQMGGTQGDTLRLTDLLAKAIKSSGAGAAEASAAMLQFGQALGSGKLAGDELRSLMETAPYLMKQLADGIGVPVGALKKLGEEGKLTADVVVEAMGKASAKINADFEKLPRTLMGAVTVMQDEFNRLALAMDDSSKMGEALTGITEGLGRVMQQLTAEIVGVRSEADALGRNARIADWADDTENSMLKMASRVQVATIMLARLGKVVYHMQSMDYGKAFDAAKEAFDPINSLMDKAEQRASAMKLLGKYTGDIGTADRSKKAAAATPFSKLTPTKDTPKTKGGGGGAKRGSGAAKTAIDDAAKQARDEENARLKAISDARKADEAQQYAASITQEGMGADFKRVMQWQEEEERLTELRAQGLLSEQTYQAAIIAAAENAKNEIDRINQERNDAEIAKNQALLTAGADFFGQTAQMIGQFAGESSGAYKAMFAASKAFAIANATLNLSTAISNASALPWPANIPAMATAAAQGASLVSQIGSAVYGGGGRKYGGPVSAGQMYRVGEGGKPEMFVGSNGENYMIPGKGGKVVGNNAMTGGGTVVNITVNNDGSSSASGSNEGAQLGRMIEGAVVSIINREKRPGGMLS